MALSPMMAQYVNTKQEYKDALLFYRVGDFYELYFEDAVTAANELDIYLTGRDCGLEKRVEMAGVPHHAVEPYIAKLVAKGYKVAICDQVGAPDSNKKGALFKREITRVVTAGTLIDSPLLVDEKNNYIASVYFDGEKASVAWADISTGEFNHSIIEPPIAISLGEILTRIAPSEIICNEKMLTASVELSIVKYGMVCPFTLYSEPSFEFNNALLKCQEYFDTSVLSKLKKHPSSVSSSGALLCYINATQKRKLGHIKNAATIKASDSMYIDANARKNLELTANMTDGSKKGSLLWLIDKTSTKPGARLLTKTVLEPLVCGSAINERLDAVEELIKKPQEKDKIIALLKDIIDIERAVGKLSYGTISPREVLKLAQSLKLASQIKPILSSFKTKKLQEINSNLTDFSDIYTLLLKAISENSPQFLREGGVINDGFDTELDEYRGASKNTAHIIANLEAAERAETGIKNLKISYTRNFGYYIELTHLQSANVPFRYVRRQTLKNAERYTTEELKILEDKILNAQDRAQAREEQLFKALLEKTATYIEGFLSLCANLSVLDVLISNALVAIEYNFIRPEVSSNIDNITIHEGRHPVVEKLLKGEQFVPNDTLLDTSDNRLMLITGPNMAGKSVYMRQVAIITILAHIGSFVPAKRAQISLTDKIFTRVGASDDLLTGRSTFMVEMSEVSTILANMSDRSLVLMDEIGRGTSTYDGLSIAWSILEFLQKNSKAKVLFSTHYHELTELEGVLAGLKNYKLTLKEISGSIVFLRKLMRGRANRSFGVEVASLAGLPKEILVRAKELLAQLESIDFKRQEKMASNQQISIFNTPKSNDEIIKILTELDIDNITPRHALDVLTDLKEKTGK